MSNTSSTRLQGKVALITGAASGIGEAAARLFAKHGAVVVVADIQDALGLQVVDSIGVDKASYYHCDVRDEKQVEGAVEHTLQTYGCLHILFSNAGVIGPLASVLDMDLACFDNTFATNVRGVAATIKHAARAMVAHNIRGSIICTASVAGCLGGVGPLPYTGTKHAVVGLVKAASSELGVHGIRVNCVSPFGVGTPLTRDAYNMEAAQLEESITTIAPLKGLVLKANHIAEAALFFASDESAFISGHNLVVDGGFTVGNHAPSVPACTSAP
ncbi:hypothetical protein vseg_014070 [Gypsophila vaccaria]